MRKLMAQARFDKAMENRQESIAEIKRAILRAKLSILAAEKQLELGSIPFANLGEAEKWTGLALSESKKIDVYEEVMKFYGEVVVA